ncbi:MAG: DUF488 family protein [candidate division KSB1 bacterium]|nr:DUF488 family protein [candidate division KSB1 bacterium]
MVKTRRVYQPKSTEDGQRILVMRYWPRGVKKTDIDRWLKDLGTSPELIQLWKKGKIEWEEFRKRYLEGLQDFEKQKLINELVEAVQNRQTITLLCSCIDERRCHRWILKELIEEKVKKQTGG